MKITRHSPVLLAEVLEALPTSWVWLDGTLGHGGHTQAWLAQEPVDATRHVVGTDRDEAMLAKARDFLAEVTGKVTFVQGSYADFELIQEQSGVKQFDAMLLDLGVNMDHFTDGARGFSIKRDGALDMRFDRSRGKTLAERLVQVRPPQLQEQLMQHGDFSSKFAHDLADDLLRAHRRKAFVTTQDIRTWCKERGMSDKTIAILFQALRIWVNDELGELQKFLQSFPQWLHSWGRCIIISYHSGEDRMVKEAFKQLITDGVWTLINKKVITPAYTEVQKNPAASSAKMRIFQKF